MAWRKRRPFDFVAEFVKSNGQPISYGGRTLRQSWGVPVTLGDTVLIRFERFVAKPVQGIGIAGLGKGTRLMLAAEEGKDFVLWTDTAPREVVVAIRKATPGSVVRIWNVWRDVKYGTTLYGLNAAAIDVHENADGSVLLQCSDGWGGPDFNDLVVRVERLRAEAP